MKTIFKKIAFVALATVVITSCVDEKFNTPVFDDCVSPGLVKNKEITALYTTATNTAQNYTADDIVEGYVVSSDEGGNFYQSMYIQPTDGSKGLNISVGEGNLYTKGFQPGRKIFLKMKGLSYANPSSFARGLIVGAAPTGIFAVDRISDIDYKKFMVPSCDFVSEDAIVAPITFTQANADTYLNKLVEFDNVQFTDEAVGGTFDSNRNDAFDSSINITSTGTTNFVVRTSRFANFAAKIVPGGRGKIRGVLTRYNSTYQIILRTERDVNFTQTRLDFNPALVGNAITYPTTFSENFESYAVTSNGTNFPKYVNDANVGSRYWDVKTNSGNKYIQMSSYLSGGTNKAYLLMPITFTPGSKFSFKTKDGFNNGAVLRVYYTTNYTPGSNNVGNANLVDITSSFNIANATVTGYAPSFIPSTNYVIPAGLTGQGFFVFEYSGNAGAGLTTTIQIDDVVVTP